MFRRNQVWQHRPAHRPIKRSHHAKQHQHRKHGNDRHSAAQGDRKQHRKTNRKPDITQDQQISSIESIRHVPGNQKEDDARKELRQPNQSEIEWPFRYFVHLPTHGDRLHLGRNHDAEPRQLKA